VPSSHYPLTCTHRGPPRALKRRAIRPRVLVSGPAAHAPAGSDTGTLAYRLYYIQAERLVLQRSTNMTGYKHVGRDMSKPRPYQVKMWRDGKQARSVAPIASPEVCTRCGLRPTDSCIPYRVAQGPDQAPPG
jgi:hypothetical protein